MKTKIQFTFTEDDSIDKLNRIINADSAYLALYQIQDFLRSEYKYNEHLPEEILNYIETLRDRVFEIMDEVGVDLERDFS